MDRVDSPIGSLQKEPLIGQTVWFAGVEGYVVQLIYREEDYLKYEAGRLFNFGVTGGIGARMRAIQGVLAPIDTVKLRELTHAWANGYHKEKLELLKFLEDTIRSRTITLNMEKIEENEQEEHEKIYQELVVTTLLLEDWTIEKMTKLTSCVNYYHGKDKERYKKSKKLLDSLSSN